MHQPLHCFIKEKGNLMDDSSANTETVDYFSKAAHFELFGENKDYFHQEFCKEIGVKKNRDITADLLVTNQRVIVSPGGKDHSDLAALGALFGAGAIGGLAVGVMGAFGAGVTKLSSRDAIKNSAGGELPRCCIVWSRSDVQFEVFEERTDWDLGGGEWETATRFSGKCNFMDRELDGVVEFLFYGRFGNSMMRSKPKAAVALLDAFSFDPSRVVRRKTTWKGKKEIVG